MRNKMRHSARTAVALLETLVAVTVLAVGGIGMVTHVAQTLVSVRRMNQRDREIRKASAELLRAQLWTHHDLARRVGRTRVPCCVMEVQPQTPSLFRVVLADTATGAPIIETSLYAPHTTP